MKKSLDIKYDEIYTKIKKEYENQIKLNKSSIEEIKKLDDFIKGRLQNKDNIDGILQEINKKLDENNNKIQIIEKLNIDNTNTMNNLLIDINKNKEQLSIPSASQMSSSNIPNAPPLSSSNIPVAPSLSSFNIPVAPSSIKQVLPSGNNNELLSSIQAFKKVDLKKSQPSTSSSINKSLSLSKTDNNGLQGILADNLIKRRPHIQDDIDDDDDKSDDEWNGGMKILFKRKSNKKSSKKNKKNSKVNKRKSSKRK